MAYDEDLANRIRELVADEEEVTERKMFGGLAFLIGGHMAVSASGRGGLLLHVDRADTEELLAEDQKPPPGRAGGGGRPCPQPFEMRGRVMEGWVRVEAEGLKTKRQLERWVARGVAHARSLPPK